MADRIAFVESSGFKAFSGKPATPFYTGQIIMSGGVNVLLPAGWLWCDGSLFSTVAYPELATVLSNNFNNGSVPSGFMRLPNFVNTLPTHKSANVGTIGGSKSHFHGLDTVGYALSNTGAHTHGYNSVNLSHNHGVNGGNTSSTGAHIHTYGTGNTNASPNRNRASGNSGTMSVVGHSHGVSGGTMNSSGEHNHGYNATNTIAQSGNHDHGGAASAGGHTHTVFGAGIIYSNDLTNIPDVVSVNFMIRAL